MSIEKENNSIGTGFGSGRILAGVFYLFVNALFIWKYSVHFAVDVRLTIPVYILLGYIVLRLVFSDGPSEKTIFGRGWFFTIVVAAGVIGIIVLMVVFDPEQIAVGRHPALNEWLADLLAGRFPYSPEGRPSGFPFLFILALPFYFLGDTGLLQLLGWVCFALVLNRLYDHDGGARTSLMTAFLCSPLFLYEAAVRSELLANMMIVLLYAVICRKKLRAESSSMTLILAGLIGGSLLSTRGIVLVIFIIFFGSIVRHLGWRSGLFFGSLAGGFVLTLIPFIIWDFELFRAYGPFAIQLLYAPFWLLILVLPAAFLTAVYVRSGSGIYLAAAFILFGVIFIPFVISSIQYGFRETILGDGFDISYFAFALPFLLISVRGLTAKG